MLAPTPPEEKDKGAPPPREPVHGVLPVLAAIILLGLFVAGCAWLMLTLINDDRKVYCIASGRHNCALVPD
jgi:hypothetical protein